jgi:hypothetical protein
LREQVSYARKDFITGNQLDLSRLYLRNAPSDFGKLFAGDLWRNICGETAYQSLSKFGSNLGRQGHCLMEDFF